VTGSTAACSKKPYYYQPINIFLNEYDGKCTSDCRAEGRNFVNPVGYEDYNPINVIDYVAKIKTLVKSGNTALIPCFQGNLDAC